ncbi:MAG: hypothetical protein JNG84_06590, partial [Archangium sp.]|nr:hypothetical protein [Archangium sp.]
MATAAGLKLDALLLAGALRFTTVDPEFTKRRGRQVSWGSPPPRFAAAEMVDIALSPPQHTAIERATAGVCFERDGDTIALTSAQFISGAALRLLQRTKPKALKADLEPFLGPDLPPAVSVEETIVPSRSRPALSLLDDSDNETVRPSVRSFFSSDAAKEESATVPPPARPAKRDEPPPPRARPRRHEADDERDDEEDDRDDETSDVGPPPIELPDPPPPSFDLRL